MKKFLGNLMAFIGAITVIWMIYAIVHFGAVNMRRTYEANYQYRLHWADRR